MFIGSGVKIGDGAVVGAKSVVTSDVPPYAVVVGCPARVIRFRFDKLVIEALLKVKWGDWPDETVNSFLPDMMKTDIEAFISKAAEATSRSNE